MSDAVPLLPPVEVMRPVAGPVPAADGLAGGAVYQAKLDGWRAVCFVLAGRVVIQTRAGRDVALQFPDVAAALAEHLAVGTVLDGELIAHDADGRLDFEALAASSRERRRRGLTTAFVAFDLLAVSGKDVRGEPLGARLQLLEQTIDGAGPLIQPCLTTRDRDEALGWMRALAPLGIEGLVAKPGASRYDPRSKSWIKHRLVETKDAIIIGVYGSPERPHRLLLQFADGTVRPTTVELGPRQARQVADAVAGTVAAEPVRGEYGRVYAVTRPVLVEARVGDGRHGQVRFVRARAVD